MSAADVLGALDQGRAKRCAGVPMGDTKKQSARSGIWMDTSAAPKIMGYSKGELSDEAIREFHASYEALLRTGKPFGLILDASSAGAPSASQRRAFADFGAQNKQALTKLCRGVAYVIESPVIRGALTAVFWINTPPYDYVVVPTLAAAEEWLAPRLERVTA